MCNPHNLSYSERAITPAANFNKGINHLMSKERRKKKQKLSMSMGGRLFCKEGMKE
jgi:tRNA A37 methylthiotransferase MiaB